MSSWRPYIPNTTANGPRPHWYSDHQVCTEPNQLPYSTDQSHWSKKSKRNKASILSHEPYIIPDRYLIYGKERNVETSASADPFATIPISCTAGCELDLQTPHRTFECKSCKTRNYLPCESPTEKAQYQQVRHQHDRAARGTGRIEFLQPTPPVLTRVLISNVNENSEPGSSTQLTTSHNSNANALHEKGSRNLQAKCTTNDNDQQHEMQSIKCYYPTCRLVFDCLDQVDEHVKTHDNVNKKTQQFKFTCDICKKKKVYARHDSIRRHQLSCQVARNA